MAPKTFLVLCLVMAASLLVTQEAVAARELLADVSGSVKGHVQGGSTGSSPGTTDVYVRGSGSIGGHP